MMALHTGVCLAAIAAGLRLVSAAGTEPAGSPPRGETPVSPKPVEEALAAANLECAELREQCGQLKLQLEALGVAALGGDEKSLTRRLLNAASDLAASERLNQELEAKSRALAESASAFMGNPGDDSLRRALEDAIKAFSSAKHSSQAALVSLDNARVVSYKPDIGLAVVNAGRESGVRMGAPMHIVRGDRSIASGLVVDVRNQVSGILLTGSALPPITVGDSVKPELTQKSPN